MDEKLQHIFCVQPNVDKIITYRTDTDLRRMIKQTYMKEIKKLLKVEIEVVHTELKLPDAKLLPPIDEQLQCKMTDNLDVMVKDCDNIMEALDLL